MHSGRKTAAIMAPLVIALLGAAMVLTSWAEKHGQEKGPTALSGDALASQAKPMHHAVLPKMTSPKSPHG
jgi:hypothetical protein